MKYLWPNTAIIRVLFTHCLTTCCCFSSTSRQQRNEDRHATGVCSLVFGDCRCSKNRPSRFSFSESPLSSEEQLDNRDGRDDLGFSSDSSNNAQNERSLCSVATNCLKYPENDSTAKNTVKRNGMLFIEGGDFIMGTDAPIIEADGEHPGRQEHVKSFWLDEAEVSNAAFDEFVKATQYQTEAEIFGDSFVFAMHVKEEIAARGAAQIAPWWWSVTNTTWRYPEGPGSNISTRMNYPVVHVSWNDARTFCLWRGGRLPTETEWEFACKKALDGRPFPWDDTKETAEEQKSANIWQGVFPKTNTVVDGFDGTAPVDAYAPMRGLPIKNIIGNVWEWTEDIWQTIHDKGTRAKAAKAEQVKAAPGATHRVKKGGSFMCHKSYCFRYRCEARSENTDDTTASNVGFRCAADATA